MSNFPVIFWPRSCKRQICVSITQICVLKYKCTTVPTSTPPGCVVFWPRSCKRQICVSITQICVLKYKCSTTVPTSTPHGCLCLIFLWPWGLSVLCCAWSLGLLRLWYVRGWFWDERFFWISKWLLRGQQVNKYSWFVTTSWIVNWF